MGTDVARLVVEVDSSGVVQAVKNLGELQAKGAAAEKGFGGFAKSVAGYTTGYALAVQATQAALRAVGELATNAVQWAMDFETARIQWGVLVGDMAKGADQMRELQGFANTTPLAFESVNKAAQTLKGFGVATADLIPTLSRLGDVAMGDNQKLQQIALVYGQVGAQGKAMTQDLYQFINAGVPIFQLLADTMGVTAGDIKELASQGKIGFKEIEAAIKAATDQGGLFYGMMDKTAETTSGKWSTAMDNFKTLWAGIGEDVLPALNDALDLWNRLADQANTNRAFNRAEDELFKKIEDFRLMFKDGGQPTWVEALRPQADQQRDLVAYFETLKKIRDLEQKQADYYGPNSGRYDEKTWTNLLGKTGIFMRELDSIAYQAGQAKAALDALAKSEAPKAAPGPSKEDLFVLDLYKKINDELTKKIDREKLLARTTGQFEDVQAEYNAYLDAYTQLLLESNGLVSEANPLAQAWKTKIDELAKALKDQGYAEAYVKSMSDNYVASLAAQKQAQDDAIKALSDAWLAKVRDADAIKESLIPAEELHQRALQKLLDLKNAGLLTDEEYAQALIKECDSYDQATKDADKFAASLREIGSALEEGAKQLYVGAFEELGAMLAKGEISADNFAQAMAQIGEQILNQLPLMLLNAGLMALGTGNIWVGLALIGASGLVAIGSGALSASSSNAARGGAYAAFALGGLVNSPEHFAFGGGIGLRGEAGPEAVFPLTRTTTGELALKGSGGGGANVSIQIVNQVGARVEQEERRGPNGEKQVKIFLRQAVRGMIANGDLNEALGGQYGVAPRGRRIN